MDLKGKGKELVRFLVVMAVAIAISYGIHMAFNTEFDWLSALIGIPIGYLLGMILMKSLSGNKRDRNGYSEDTK